MQYCENTLYRLVCPLTLWIHELNLLTDINSCIKVAAIGETIAHVGQAACKAKGKISMAKLKKKFSLSTYKYHAMGDYPAMIHAFGTTDSYSTQSVRALSC